MPPIDPADFDPSMLFGMGATNPEMAAAFLQQHRGDMANREKQIEENFNKQQLTVDNMTKMLDETTNALKAARAGRNVSLPLMSMAAGMLTGQGNFGDQLGRGFAGLAAGIGRQREDEESFNMQLANLALKRGALEQGPLTSRLDYLKALQTGDLSSIRNIESALIRSQGRDSTQEQQRIQRAISDSINEGRKQIDSLAKDYFATPEEREAEMNRRILENLQMYRSAGVNIPEDVFLRYSPQGRPATPGSRITRPKGFYEAPLDPKSQEMAREQGLPKPPVGYVYSRLTPDKTAAQYQREMADFDKDSKDWDTQSSQAATMMTQLARAEYLMKNHPGITGWQHGMPTHMLPNVSAAAQELDSIFKHSQVSSVPKGQGAVSDFERALFEKSAPNQRNSVEANMNLIQLQRAILQRDQEKRSFFNDYFSMYGTTKGAMNKWTEYINSPAGNFVVQNEKGQLVPNLKRLDWREFFRNQWTEGKARGGPIKLGAEFD